MQYTLYIMTTLLPVSKIGIVNQSLPERGSVEVMELGFIINYDIKCRMGWED